MEGLCAQCSRLSPTMSGLSVGVRFQEKYEGYCMLVACASIIATSSTSLFVHLRRSKSLQRYGMLLMTLITFILYSLINLLQFAFKAEYPSFWAAVFPDSKRIYWINSAQYLSELITSLTGIFLALDRLLVMSIPFNYAFYKVGQKLAIVDAVIVSLIILIHTALVVFVDFWTFFADMLILFIVTVMQIILPAALVVESLLHVVFCVKLYRYLRNSMNPIAKNQTAQTNHITFCQVVCHSLLCAIPNLLVFVTQLHKDLNVGWVDDLYFFYRFAFAVSVMLASAFTLYKLRPAKCFTKIATSSSRPFSHLRYAS